MCNIDHYPEKILETKITPALPTKLPSKQTIIMKSIDNFISLNDVENAFNERFEGVFSVEDLSGVKSYISRHIRADLLSTDEYHDILNTGRFAIDGQLFMVEEFLPTPKVLICHKCFIPGHINNTVHQRLIFVKDVAMIEITGLIIKIVISNASIAQGSTKRMITNAQRSQNLELN